LSAVLEKILEPFNKLIRWSMILSFSLMVIFILMQILYRYVLIRPIPWAEEAARFLFVWATFLGANVAVRTNQHTNVSFLIDRVPEKYRKIMLLASYALSMAFMIYILIYGLRISFLVTRQTSPALQLSMFYPYIVLPVGALIMLLNFLLLFLKETEKSKPVFSGKIEVKNDKENSKGVK